MHRIVGLVVDRELVFHLKRCKTCSDRLQRGKLQLKHVKQACFEITEPGFDGTSQVSTHMAVGYIPTRVSSRYPDDIADPADIADRSTLISSGFAAHEHVRMLGRLRRAGRALEVIGSRETEGFVTPVQGTDETPTPEQVPSTTMSGASQIPLGNFQMGIGKLWLKFWMKRWTLKYRTLRHVSSK